MNADINHEYIDGQSIDGTSTLQQAFNSMISSITAGGSGIPEGDYLALDSKIIEEKNARISAINTEITNRSNADTNLQGQIDLLNIRSLQGTFDTNPSDLNFMGSGKLLYIDTDLTATDNQVIPKKQIEDMIQVEADIRQSEFEYTQEQIADLQSRTLQFQHTTNASDLDMLNNKIFVNDIIETDLPRTIVNKQYVDDFKNLVEQQTNQLEQLIQDETTRAANAESGIQQQLEEFQDLVAQQIDSLDTAIQQETVRAINAETGLQESITQEMNRAIGSEMSLSQQITEGLSTKYDNTTTLNNIQKPDNTLDLNGKDIIGIATLYTNDLDATNITVNQLYGTCAKSALAGSEYVTANEQTGAINTLQLNVLGQIANEKTRAETAEQGLLDQIVDKMSVFTKLNEIPLANHEVDLNNNRIINLYPPESNLDATNKQYVDEKFALISQVNNLSLSQIQSVNPSTLDMGTKRLYLRSDQIENPPQLDEEGNINTNLNEAVSYSYVGNKFNYYENLLIQEQNARVAGDQAILKYNETISIPTETIQDDPQEEITTQETVIYGKRSRDFFLSNTTKLIVSGSEGNVQIQNGDLDMKTNKIINCDMANDPNDVVILQQLQDGLNLKRNINDSYNKTEIDDKTNNIQQQLDLTYNKIEVDNLLTERDIRLDELQSTDLLLYTEINSEKQERISANTNIQNQINLKSNQTDLQTEITQRQLADTTLQNNINLKADQSSTYTKTQTDSLLSDKTSLLQVNNLISADYKNKIRFDANENCKIQCSNGNQIDFYANGNLLGKVYQPVGQSTNPFGIQSNDKIQLQSNLSSISVYGAKPIDSNIAVLNTHGLYVSGIDNPSANVQATINVGTANSAQLYLTGGHLYNGQKYSGVFSDSQLTLSSSLNPQSIEPQINLYTSTQAESIPIQFNQKSGYSSNIIIDQSNQFTSKQYVDSAISSISSSSNQTLQEIQNTNPLSSNLDLGQYSIQTSKSSFNSNELITKAFIDTNYAKMSVGSIVIWYSTSIPSGWLLCDGSTFSSTTYPDLFNLLGTTTLPDFRGYCLRGKGYTTGRDSWGDRPIGQVQGDGNKAHTHTYQDAYFGENWNGIPQNNIIGSQGNDGDNEYRARLNNGGSGNLFDATSYIDTSSSGNSEVTVKNVCVNFIICASTTASGVASVGMGAVTQNIDMQSLYKLTNLINGSLSSDSCTYGQLTSAISGLSSTYMPLSYRLDQISIPTASINVNSQKITNLALASSSGDAVSVQYINNQGFYNANSSIPKLRFNTTDLCAQFTNANTFKISKQTSSAYYHLLSSADNTLEQYQDSFSYFGYTSGASLKKLNDTAEYLNRPLWISNSQSLNRDAVIYINRPSSSTLNQRQYSLFIQDEGNSGNYQSNGVYFDCQFTQNRPFTANGQSQFNDKVYVGSWDGTYAGVTTTAGSRLIVGQNNSTDQLSISAEGKIYCSQLIEIVPISERCFKNIDCTLEQTFQQLQDIELIKYTYCPEKLRQKGYRKWETVSKKPVIGVCVDQIPDCFKQRIRSEDFECGNQAGYCTVDLTKLKDHLFAMLVSDNKKHKQRISQLENKLQEQETRLKLLEKVILGQLE